MKLLKRNLSMAAAAVFASQLFFSCASNNLQSSKNDFNAPQNLAIAQNIVTESESKLDVVNISASNVENQSKNAIINVKSGKIAIAGNAKNTVAENKIQVQTKQITETVNVTSSETREPASKIKDINKLTSHKAEGKGKSQLIALVLSIVGGWLGIHRFYLGYIWQGIAQAAGFILGFLFSFILIGIPLLIGIGIWILIDIIRIIIGSLKPKNGEYTSTLGDL